MAVLKAARQLSLVKGLEVVSVPGHPPVRVPGALLQQAISHANEGLLVDAMTLACVHPKTATMPGVCAQHASPDRSAGDSRSVHAVGALRTMTILSGRSSVVSQAHKVVPAFT